LQRSILRQVDLFFPDVTRYEREKPLTIMKSIGVSILMMAASISVFGQSADRLLASGDPPLMQSTVDQLIDFFEFGLHSKFDPAERAEFRAQRVAEWKNGDQKGRDAILSILELRRKLTGLDDSKLREAQVSVQSYLLEFIAKRLDVRRLACSNGFSTKGSGIQ